MNNKLSTTSRILVSFASGALIAVFFLPAWRIDLFAPQYPEGLSMYIWVNGLSGNVDIINGLNHYIGMKPISPEMFPEFSYLPYIVGFFMLFGMTVAITGKRKLLFIYLVLSVIGGALAMYDFYRWGYDYGHHLDPNAAIQVKDFSYQPPLIGHKRLLNFDAYSFPDVAGWIVIAAGMLAFGVWFVEWYKHRKPARQSKLVSTVATAACLILFISCSSKPAPIQLGKDNCDFCRMTITDPKFGGEIVTKKGKTFKFDDIHCMVGYLHANTFTEKDLSHQLVVNYDTPNDLIDAKTAFYLVSPSLNSPMGSNTAGFSTRAAAEKINSIKPGNIVTWEKIYQQN